LTEGWSGSDWTGDAITCTATEPIKNKDPSQGVDLGFVQVARGTIFHAFYAGRIPSEGSIGLNFFIPPAFPQSVVLDGSGNTPDPWYRVPRFELAGGGKRLATFGDHPGLVIPLKLSNNVRSQVPNFLFHTYMEREFWTILTAIEAGKRTYLAYFQWQLRYEFKVRWQASKPQVAANLSSFRIVHNFVLGAPPDSELQSKLNSPTGERANAIGKRCQILTETGAPPNRSDNQHRFPAITDSFWS